MLFNSFEFIIFLPIVFALYWLVPHKFRWIVVLVSSYYFYMRWNAKYLMLIVFITGISYLGAMIVQKTKEISKKKCAVGGVVAISLALLFVFKYFNFISESISDLFNWFQIPTTPIVLSLLLPVGISFYTFQSIGYIIDVYRGDIEAERHFGKYAAFISFFPQLVAGPIERTKNLLPQLQKKQIFDYQLATYGLKLMAWGYFKKVVIADTMAIYVDKIYADMHYHTGFSRLVVIFFFAIQIYCDFSGYSDIARGTAKLFGINLMENFKSPYFSTSIKEFWKRWHISLSTWFRDYVYIPLGGNRVGRLKGARNVVLTFLLSGIWHGASWNFATWGFLHGTMQVCENETKRYFPAISEGKVLKVLKVVVTFCLISVLWTVFRAETIKDAGYMCLFIFNGFTTPLEWIRTGCLDLGLNAINAVRIFIMVLMLGLYDYFSLKYDVIDKIGKLSLVSRWMIYLIIPILIFLWAPSSSAEFIYFDF